MWLSWGRGNHPHGVGNGSIDWEALTRCEVERLNFCLLPFGGERNNPCRVEINITKGLLKGVLQKAKITNGSSGT